ncbi:MAG: hypothetical protein GF320_10720 [Armatimonadia bacterium]|nr:hypothetical protein [Armatimonadia bacterium]
MAGAVLSVSHAADVDELLALSTACVSDSRDAAATAAFTRFDTFQVGSMLVGLDSLYIDVPDIPAEARVPGVARPASNTARRVVAGNAVLAASEALFQADGGKVVRWLVDGGGDLTDASDSGQAALEWLAAVGCEPGDGAVQSMSVARLPWYYSDPVDEAVSQALTRPGDVPRLADSVSLSPAITSVKELLDGLSPLDAGSPTGLSILADAAFAQQQLVVAARDVPADEFLAAVALATGGVWRVVEDVLFLGRSLGQGVHGGSPQLATSAEICWRHLRLLPKRRCRIPRAATIQSMHEWWLLRRGGREVHIPRE